MLVMPMVIMTPAMIPVGPQACDVRGAVPTGMRMILVAT